MRQPFRRYNVRTDQREVSTIRAAASAALAPAPAKDALQRPQALPYRVGHGFDLHRLEEGPYKLILGGLEIPHDRGCVAHSDGDALLHTVTDAILGALCQPDIGQLFPDNDPKWKGQTSDVFLLEAVRLMREFGYVLGNLDATIILQRPKLSPHKEKIRANLCQLLGADPSVVNIKAKTHEKVDSLGENRSIAVHAVCMLIREDLMS
ncbi:g7357 [Coccomyxa elongata]